MLKHYVKFWYPGISVSENTVEEIESKDIQNIEVPQNAYAFSLYDIEIVEFEGEILRGKPKNVSSMYYCGGTKKNYRTVCKEKGSDSILAGNMLCNNWDCVIETPYHQYFPIRDKDILLTTWTVRVNNN